MADANEFIEALKRAAVKAMEAKKPVNVYFGEVVSTAPLKINVEQKMVLGEKQLILARNVTDYVTTVSIPAEYGWETQNRSGGSGEAAYASHNHGIVINKQKITVHDGLVVGDEVILIRQQEGQKFIVIDRIGGK